jgi:hypothetical protein
LKYLLDNESCGLVVFDNQHPRRLVHDIFRDRGE